MSLSVEESAAQGPPAGDSTGRETVTSVVLRVAGASNRIGPASWGQMHMLRHFANAGANAHLFSIGDVIPVPAGCDLGRLLTALRETLCRYETFRTTCRSDGAEARQIVTGDGELTVGLHEVPADRVEEVAERVARSLAARAFTPESGWPVRFEVVLCAGRPVILAVAFSHLALDAGGAQVALPDLLRLMAGDEPGPPPAWQPLDQARYEQSPEGQALNRQSIEHLRQVLRSAPASMFDFPTREPVADRAVVLEMHSPAAVVASEVLAGRLGVSSSSVLLAAVAVLLGLYSGRTATVLQLVAANRTSEPLRSLVANIALDGICFVDFTGLSFEQVIRRAFEASVSTYLNSQAHPDLRWATIEKQKWELGRHICLSAAFNDGRDEAPIEDGALDEPLANLLPRTEVVRHQYPFGGGRFYVGASGHGLDGRFTFVADAWYLPHETMTDLLYGFERLLVTAAAGDIPAADLAGVAGVRPAPRNADWVRCRDGYADLTATRELWRKVSGSTVADVYAVAVDGGFHRLVGYVHAPAGNRPIASLHRDFMQALDDSTAVRAPDWYVRCLAAPASRADRAGWSAAPVAEEGRGR